MRGKVAIVGIGRTPYSRCKPGERILTVEEYLAWAADLAVKDAGMSKTDFDGQGLGVAHAEAGHTVNWAAAVAESLGISPKILLRGDQGGSTAGALLIRAAAMINSGIVDRVLVLGADTPLTIPSIAPGLPLSPERTHGVFWDFQGPFGVMGAGSQFAFVQHRYMHQHDLTLEQLGKIAVTTRFHASLNPSAIYRKPITVDEYVNSRVLSSPIRLLDCVPMVNGGLGYVVMSAKSAKALGRKPVYLLGFGEVSNYYGGGSRTRPDITCTGFAQAAPEALNMAGVSQKDIDVFEPYDDYPMVVLIQMEEYGFCKKGQGGKFVEERNMAFDGDFPVSTDGGQLSGGQPGGAIGGFMPIVEAVTQLRGEGGERQVKNARIAAASGFGGISYARNARSSVSMIFGSEG